ncbi:tRNA guanosine(15) transglycosylase TgtA [Desulfurococcus mucosus]|uniref:tRNA-guanine(15) transglycosylase n=1 Tax=Desulfurococcus mucosus (strain ATCC 35584 / DSM 2162 / JCM 9187 / O7/1) TaxID=765177 RepID=E8R779_DESM0|nr:tRNA guanosine(15) transglycosylase TgtA [Desulfurococcus mucosus]ADV65544.1 archaeosine tRNA-ribosyltransferase [Desulfurococcus mucosus DSM 2162]
MFFEPREYDLAGRLARLTTRHGVIETPYLFPVVDPLKQEVSLDKLLELGFNGIITNAYLFYKRNKGVVKPIHGELKWDKTIMTDSGGYQVLVYGDVEVDNRTIVAYQRDIGVDIGVILDKPTGNNASYREAVESVYETYRRAVEASPLISGSDQLWTLPIQGLPYRDLVLRSSILAWRLPVYSVYAVGSPTVLLERYSYSKIVELTLLARITLPPGKPIHVFGVGHPMILPFLVAAGGDLFDSASYILYARDERYMVETGTRSIRDLHYLPCNCPVCSRYTVRELLELPRRERVRLLALHNLYMLAKELRSIRQAIMEGRLWEMLEHRSRGHPSLREAFRVLVKHRDLLKRYNPLTKPDARALLIVDRSSAYNPRVESTYSRVLGMLGQPGGRGYLVVIPAYRKPYTSQEEYAVVSEKYKGNGSVRIVFLHPFLGVVPPELASTYPFYQHESRFSRGDIPFERIRGVFMDLAGRGFDKIVVVESGWFDRELYARLVESSPVLKGKLAICRINEISSLIPQ